MPYIDPDKRDYIDQDCGLDTFRQTTAWMSVGELNYVITTLIRDWILHQNEASYTHLNAAIGVLECAKQELYRRLAAPYEDRAKERNGDVYAPELTEANAVDDRYGDLYDDIDGPDHGSHGK